MKRRTAFDIMHTLNIVGMYQWASNQEFDYHKEMPISSIEKLMEKGAKQGFAF